MSIQSQIDNLRSRVDHSELLMRNYIYVIILFFIFLFFTPLQFLACPFGFLCWAIINLTSENDRKKRLEEKIDAKLKILNGDDLPEDAIDF